MKNAKIWTMVAGGLANVISTILSINLYMKMGSTGADQGLYGGVGMTLQLLQVATFIVCWFSFKQGKKGIAIPAFLIFMVLMGLSITASVGFFSKVSTSAASAEMENDIVYNSYRQRLSQIDTESTATLEDLGECKKNWVKNCIEKHRQALTVLKKERADVLDKISGFRINRIPESDSLFHNTARFFKGDNCTAEDVLQVKMFLFLVTAIIFDLAGAFCLGYGLYCNYQEPEPEPGGSARGNIQNQYRQSFAGNQFSDGVIAGNDGAAFQAYQAAAEQNRVLMQELEQQRFNPEFQTVMAQNRALQERLEQLERQRQPGFTSKDFTDDPGSFEKQQKDVPVGSSSYAGSADNDPGSLRIQPKDVSIGSSYVGSVGSYVAIEDAEELIRYIESAFQLNRDGSLKGRLRIAKDTGISNDDCVKCHKWLKTKGYIAVDGNKSFPVADKEHVLEEVTNDNMAV